MSYLHEPGQGGDGEAERRRDSLIAFSSLFLWILLLIGWGDWLVGFRILEEAPHFQEWFFRVYKRLL